MIRLFPISYEIRPLCLSLLSSREEQVFFKLVCGINPEAIALQLGLSKNTIHTYKLRIMGKLDFSSTAQLVAFAIVERLITVESSRR